MEGFDLAVFAPRTAGELRVAVLQPGDGAAPPLAVQFAVPDYLDICKADAKAAEAMAAIREASGHLGVYGLKDRKIPDDDLLALSRLVSSVETAKLLWRDWNFAEVPKGKKDPVKLALTPANILRLLEDAGCRAAWLAHFDNASPLERAEGNGSAASLTGSTASAANSADSVGSSTDPVPADSQTSPGGSAPE
jgi:hypothetical protein